MTEQGKQTEERIDRLHAPGLVDMHFDLLMDLSEKRDRTNVLATEFLPEFEAGQIGVLGVAIFIEDRYLPEMALRVALDQIALLQAEVEKSDRFAICRSNREIQEARKAGRIALLITMEGVEPLGTDLNLLRIFVELGVRSIGLTHARRNAAGAGGVFAPSGSPDEGLTAFGRDLVQACEEFGLMLDLAHINPRGFDELFALATRPLIVSHTNARRYHDLERNISDEQIKMVGERRGVIGINTVLVSARKEEATLDRYVDHIEHVAGLIGLDGVGIGFDFFEFIFCRRPEIVPADPAAAYTRPHFIPNLTNHSQARNLTRRLIERGFTDEQIEKILFRNWMRMFEQLL
ncbi:MAG: dipeptidase [Verrucomicrobiota bacterium]|nr:dipeptidase [Verrucomicrobiota bacterium]